MWSLAQQPSLVVVLTFTLTKGNELGTQWARERGPGHMRGKPTVYGLA